MVAQERSISAAARQLGVSSAAVSKQITKLESELKMQLLIRSTRVVSLTDMGHVYFEQCQRILEEVNAADNLVSQLKETPSGTLRVCSPPHFTSKYITPFLPEFFRLYPDIQLQLFIAERFPSFDAESLDVIMGASVSMGNDTIQRRIATTCYTICASPGYLKDNGIPDAPDDLPRHKCIAHSGRKPMNRFYLKQNGEVPFQPYICVNDTQTMVKMAELGMGIVQLHHYVVKDSIEEGRLVSLLDEHSRGDVPIYLALPPRRFTPIKVRCFIDFVVDKVKRSEL